MPERPQQCMLANCIANPHGKWFVAALESYTPAGSSVGQLTEPSNQSPASTPSVTLSWMAPERLEVGTTLGAGRYEILRPLGAGSQGQTLAAIDLRTGTHVAIKRFNVRGAESWKDVELAEREARVLAQLSHPALPEHLDHFEEDGALYLVMTLIEGDSLAELRRRGELLDTLELLDLLRQMSSVLRYLSQRAPSVVHRDIKPGNIIRRPDGSFALVDFGSVRDHLKPGGSTVVGTFGYMAPEQFQGRALPASDVYGLGATALTMLTGAEPEDQPHQGLAIDVARALERRASDPRVRLLSQMLAPNPEQRVHNLTRALAELARPSSGGDGSERPRAPKARERRPAPRQRKRRNAPPKAPRGSRIARADDDDSAGPPFGATRPGLLLLAGTLLVAGFLLFPMATMLLLLLGSGWWIVSSLFFGGAPKATEADDSETPGASESPPRVRIAPLSDVAPSEEQPSTSRKSRARR